MLDLLFGLSFPGVALLAVAGRVIVRLGVVAAAGSTAGRGLRFLGRRTTFPRVLGGRATAVQIAALAAEAAAAVAVEVVAALLSRGGRGPAWGTRTGFVSAGGNSLRTRTCRRQVEGGGSLEQQLDGP
eukprot:104357-Pleurochrysis_carterae.AAC.1